MKPNDCYEIGYVTKTHGLKGEVTIQLDVDEPESYAGLDSAFVELKKQLVPFFIQKINIQQTRAIVKFEGINTLEEAHTLLHSKVMLPVEALPPSDNQKFYLHDILGYTVEDKTKGKLGVITQLYEGTHQDILGMDYQNVEVLIPVVDAIVLGADFDSKILFTNLPDGLVELYLNEEN